MITYFISVLMTSLFIISTFSWFILKSLNFSKNASFSRLSILLRYNCSLYNLYFCLVNCNISFFIFNLVDWIFLFLMTLRIFQFCLSSQTTSFSFMDFCYCFLHFFFNYLCSDLMTSFLLLSLALLLLFLLFIFFSSCFRCVYLGCLFGVLLVSWGRWLYCYKLLS